MNANDIRSLVEADGDAASGAPAIDPAGAEIVNDIKAGEINVDTINGYIESVHELEKHYRTMVHTMHKMVSALRVREALQKAGVDEKNVVNFMTAGNFGDTSSLGVPTYRDWKLEGSEFIGVIAKDPNDPKKLRHVYFDTPVRRTVGDAKPPEKYTGHAPKRRSSQPDRWS